MKQGGRKLGFWILLTAYAAGSVWWVLSVPRSPDALLRAIPGFAYSVSVHDHLADRWAEQSKHPLVLSLVSAFDGDPEEWSALEDDPGFNRLLQLVGRDRLVAAYVPYLGFRQERAWVLASWIGGQSQRLRWFEGMLDLPGLQRIEDQGGWPVWTWTWNTDAGTRRISLALVEGMIIACTSSDPSAMETVLEAYNGVFPSVATRKDLKPWNDRILNGTRADRLYFQPVRAFGIDYPDPVYAAFDLQKNSGVEGVVSVHRPADWPDRDGDMEITDLAELWGDRPIAASALKADWINRWTDASPSGDLAAALVADIMGAGKPEGVAVALFGGDYSGRFKGIRVPSLMAAVYLPEVADIEGRMRAVIDLWNARYRWGLVPVSVPVGSATVWRLEGTANNLYSSLAPAEQVSLTVAGNWLVAASNLKCLETLVSAPVTGQRAPDWAKRVNEALADKAEGYLGVDLVRGTEAFRLAITAYSLKLLFEDASGSRVQRQNLNEAKAWLEVLAQLERLNLVATSSAEQLTFEFTAGPQIREEQKHE